MGKKRAAPWCLPRERQSEPELRGDSIGSPRWGEELPPSPELQAFVDQFIPRCILCNGPGDVQGLMAPNDSQLFGAPRGKTRYFRYAVCFACFGRPDVGEAVDEKILTTYSRGDA